jgi:DNA-binding CsgD family transcriptional regulator
MLKPIGKRSVSDACEQPADHGGVKNWETTMNTVRLTGREAEVVRLIARGCTYARIAGLLGVSEHTVASHIKNAYRKLEVHSAGAAVMRAIELQQIT